MESTFEHQSTTTYQKQVVASTASGFVLENMDIMFLSFTLSSIISELHISSTAAGWIGTITNFGMLVGGVIFGILADRIGRIKTFSHTIFIFALATAAMYFANNLTLIYVCRFLAGIGAGGEYGIGMAIIAESFPRHQVGKITSIASIGGQVGALVAAFLAAWILPSFGWHALFLFGIVPVILTYFVRRHLKESPSFLKTLPTKKTTHNGLGHALKILFNSPQATRQTFSLMIMTIVQIAGYFGLMTWLPSIMQTRLHLTVGSSSLWMISTIVGMSLGMAAFGLLLDKFGPRLTFGIFLLMAAVSVYLLLAAQNMQTLVLFGTIVGFFSNGMFGGYGAVISQLYPTEIRATANNIIMNVGRCVGGFSSVLIGILLDHFSITIVILMLSILYIISFISMLSIKNLGLHFLVLVNN
ncbi:MFS transporter [Pediococcus inopinatus]|uniref:MFS transporter n=1 Tax=Pediococcus inopinatus TaxID=114090 RepID=UPI002B25C931|nr:MFS transporter [Pediococcus inopinatus]WPC17819.1 MFS transporter [Pediococcus inopinatus]